MLNGLQFREDEKFIFPSNFIEESNFEIIITLLKVIIINDFELNLIKG